MSNQTISSKLWILPVAWWLSVAVFHVWMVQNSGFSTFSAIADSITSVGMLFVISTGAAFSIKYYRPKPEQSWYLLIGVIVLAVAWDWLCFQILSSFLESDIPFLKMLNDTKLIRIFAAVLMISLFVMVGWISYYLNEKLEEQRHNQEIVRMSKESELNSLRQKLQPHFLFNTLNSISALSASNPELARKMIHQLSDFFRGTLKNEGQQMSNLGEEIHHLELYLEIEKIRFGNRLRTSINIQKGTENLPLPSLLLQPLVENAIKFGLYDTLEPVSIELTAKREDPYLIIEITNPFDEQTGKKVAGTGFGLNSVHRRLYIIYGRNDLLTTSSTNGTFKATLKIPSAA